MTDLVSWHFSIIMIVLLTTATGVVIESNYLSINSCHAPQTSDAALEKK